MPEEFKYVMVESGVAPIAENNIMPHPISLTTGEANHTNEQLESFHSNQRYIKLIEDEDSPTHRES